MPTSRRRTLALAVIGVLCVVAVLPRSTLASSNATARASAPPSFLDCLSAVRGRTSRSSLLNADDDQRDAFLGRVMGCVRAPVLRGLRAVRAGKGGDVQLGAVHLHRLPGAEGEVRDDAHPIVRDEEAAARALRGEDDDGADDLLVYHDLIVELDRVSRSYAMDVEVYPGVKASLHRDARSEDAVNLSFKLDRAGLEEDEDAVDVEDEDDQEGRGIVEDYVIEDRHGHKKKKVLKGLKKLKKKLKPYLPLLAIPLAIQLMMLPLYIMALKMMALKSILLGKMTLMLVAFNILRNVQQRQMEDDHNSRVAAEYYGYNDDGIEYGGWVNRRAFSGRSGGGAGGGEERTPYRGRQQRSQQKRR